MKIEVKQVDWCVLGNRPMCSSNRCNGVYARLTIECLLVEELKFRKSAACGIPKYKISVY